MPLQENGKIFKSLDETYNRFTFLLAVGLMYPNPKTDKMRTAGVIYLLCVPMFLILCNDIRIRQQNNDVQNLVRQVVIFVALMFANTKSFLTIIYKKELREIYDSINVDYAAFNDLPEDFQELVEDTINKSKSLETVWLAIVSTTGGIFPGSALLLNVYFFLFTDTPRRFMLHECHIWNLTPEQQYSSPVYEIFFLYCCFITLVIVLGFSGFDGMFSICMFHLSLKIKIIMKKLEYVLDKSDLAKTKANIAQILRDQSEVYNLRDKLLKGYEVWLVLIFILSVTQTAMALSQITSSKQMSGATLSFILFGVTCTAHIYFPCYLSSEVTHTAAKVSDVLYSTQWEDISDTSIRRSIMFMIARAQKPMVFKAMDLITFNMEMFMSVMQTAYSMLTLLRK
ncbi:odorant receptor 4-like isoform X2 [Epargyreus clarus]|uniref:odorant receptor 4-like isoform X2 n=1 Tax=Epargyreus clarus TaxID=520877 RepID=UPI003C2C5349